MAIDGNRALVANAFHQACIAQGIERDQGVWLMLTFWGCHRGDWEPLPSSSAPGDLDEAIRRREACTAAIREAERQGDLLPDAIVERMIRWSWEQSA